VGKKGEKLIVDKLEQPLNSLNREKHRLEKQQSTYSHSRAVLRDLTTYPNCLISLKQLP
jgi:hypothetical protein